MTEQKPKALSTKELGNVIDSVLKENAVLSAESKNIMAKMYERFRHVILNGMLSYEDGPAFTMMIADLMSSLNSFSLDGIEKKQILLELIRIVIRFEVSADQKDKINTFVDTFVPSAIDLAVCFQKQNSRVSKNKIRACLCM